MLKSTWDTSYPKVCWEPLGDRYRCQFFVFNQDPEDRLLADVPLRCCVPAASHTGTQGFFSSSFFFNAHIHRGLDRARVEGGYCAQTLTALRSVTTEHRAATIRPPGFPFSLDSIIKTGQIWTPLRFGRSFCTVIIIVIIYFWRRRRRRGGQRRRKAAQWIRWFHFLRFDFVCCSRLVEVSQLLRF